MKLTSILSKAVSLFLLQGFLCSPALPENEPAKSIVPLPKEVVVLKLPKNELKWKETLRVISPEYCTVERIPAAQEDKKWSELIGIQVFREAGVNKRTVSIDRIADAFKQETINRYPGNKVTWTQLRKTKSDLIYEWILHSQFKNTPPQHEIARLFLTDEGIHRIGFTRQHREMSEAERSKWIEIIEEDVSLEILEHAYEMEQTISIW